MKSDQPPVSSSAWIDIDTGADRVWELLADIDRWPRWNGLVQHAALAGPLQPGSSFRWKSRGLTVVSTLQQVTPGRCIAWTGRAVGTRAVHAWEIEPAGHGVRLRTEETFEGWLPRLMPRALQRGLDATLQAWLEQIRREAERR